MPSPTTPKDRSDLKRKSAVDSYADSQESSDPSEDEEYDAGEDEDDEGDDEGEGDDEDEDTGGAGGRVSGITGRTKGTRRRKIPAKVEPREDGESDEDERYMDRNQLPYDRYRQLPCERIPFRQSPLFQHVVDKAEDHRLNSLKRKHRRAARRDLRYLRNDEVVWGRIRVGQMDAQGKMVEKCKCCVKHGVDCVVRLEPDPDVRGSDRIISRCIHCAVNHRTCGLCIHKKGTGGEEGVKSSESDVPTATSASVRQRIGSRSSTRSAALSVEIIVPADRPAPPLAKTNKAKAKRDKPVESTASAKAKGKRPETAKRHKTGTPEPALVPAPRPVPARAPAQPPAPSQAPSMAVEPRIPGPAHAEADIRRQELAVKPAELDLRSREQERAGEKERAERELLKIKERSEREAREAKDRSEREARERESVTRVEVERRESVRLGMAQWTETFGTLVKAGLSAEQALAVAGPCPSY